MMRRWFVLAGLLVLGTIVVTTEGFVCSDPFANQVTIEKTYYGSGNIACEASFNRRHELHGWQVVYDEEGRVSSEVLFERGEWLLSRTYGYETGLLRIGDAGFANPRYTVERIPDEYYEYRRIESRTEPTVAE